MSLSIELNDLKHKYGRNDSTSSKSLLNNIVSSSVDDEDYLNEIQEYVIKNLIENDYFKLYKLSRKYELGFYKCFIGLIENRIEVNSVIYDYYIQLLDNNSNPAVDGDTKYFNHFYFNIKNEIPIIIEQYESIISNGTTGLHIWPAAHQLINYLLSSPLNATIFDDKNVLELGSGIGLVGLFCLQYFTEMKTFTFTDVHDLVLKQIEKNLKVNSELNGNVSLFSENRARILELDWNNMTITDNQCFNDTDVIIASDIIYDCDLIDSIISTIKCISNRNTAIYTIISSTIRNEETYSTFINKLKLNDFKIEILRETPDSSTPSSPPCIVQIIKIFI